ncbi:hypothetical protein B0T17DRAFT_534391 [Bombardia bombarda]|uniref:Uncharacterized protein n=1 Tax=Bombardia bombarda TaxID=252184 RepID=A0AA39WU82_9PEZI|nr:hypothetical protein B0T17DRAFT_534391 [Bombardia bombarda]
MQYGKYFHMGLCSLFFVFFLTMGWRGRMGEGSEIWLNSELRFLCRASVHSMCIDTTQREGCCGMGIDAYTYSKRLVVRYLGLGSGYMTSAKFTFVFDN